MDIRAPFLEESVNLFCPVDDEEIVRELQVPSRSFHVIGSFSSNDGNGNENVT